MEFLIRSVFRNIFLVSCFGALVLRAEKVDLLHHSHGKAKLAYCNPSYVANCSVVTYEKKGALLTNTSFEFLVPFGNNVTVVGILESTSGIRFKVDRKYCDYFKQRWLLEFLRPQEMKLPPPCPTPGRFHLEDMNFPPAKIPIPVRSGRYNLRLEFSMTDTKELLIALDVRILYCTGPGKGTNKKVN